jgi:pimeloyl-ACP methyl ester carboxylesterase
MDALKIEKATIAGFDCGARTANIIAALWPERCKAMVSVSGWGASSTAAEIYSKRPLLRNLNLRFHAVWRHLQRKVECLNAILKFECAAN